ncbi:hypothetical protein ACJMK2_009727 [Sinanodonta woodiana]
MDNDDDMHLCLVCHTTIMGLLNYVQHKKTDCPGRKNAESQFGRQSVQDLPPNQISSEPSRENTENTSSLHFSSNVTVVSEPQLVNDFNLTSTSSQFLSPQPKESSSLKPLFQSSMTQSPISSSGYNMGFTHLSTAAQANPRIRQNLYQEQSVSRSTDREGNSFASVNLSDSFNDTQDFSDRGVVGLVQGDLLQRDDFSSNVNVRTTSISVDIPSSFSSLVSDISPASNGTVNPNDVISTESKLVPNPSESVDNFFLSLELRSKTSVETNQPVHKQSQRKEHAFILPDDCGERLAEDLPISNILSHLTFSSDEEDIDLNFADNVPLDDGLSDDSNDGFNLPTLHTGGKWKPGMGPGSKSFSSNLCSGKWKPGEAPEPKKRGRPPKRGRPRGKSMHETKKETVTGDKMYLCNFCNVSFYNRFQYSHHCGSKTHRENVFGKEGMQRREARVNLDDEHVQDQEQEDTPSSEKKLEEHEGPAIDENNAEQCDSTEYTKAISKDEQDPVHVCTICDKKYNNKYVMSRHLITKFHNNRSKGRPGAITLMQKYYKYIVRLSPFQCEICCFYFNQETYFKHHMESEAHMNNCKDLYGEMVCSLCSYKTHSHDELLVHLKSQEHEALVAKRNKLCIVKESHVKVGCRYCGMVMYSYTRLKRHIVRRHKDRKKTEPVKRVMGGFRPLCSVCNRQMSSQHALTIHMRRHKREKPYYCSPCNKGFTDKGALQMHEKTGKHTKAVVQLGQLSVKDVKNDKTDTNVFKTEEVISSECFKVDESMDDFSGNIEASERLHDYVSDGNDPSLKSRIVSKSVVSSQKNKPQRTKSNRRFKCDHCDFTVSSYNELRPHYLEVHSSKVKLCEVCDLVFLSDKAMNLHNHSKAHQENINKLSGNAADTNFFTCKVCKKRFSDENYCRFHEEFHHYSINSEEGVLKKYEGQDLTRKTFGAVLKKIECLHRTAEVECPECSRKLKKVNFIEHLRMHCNDKPFVCRLCTSGFISAVTLRRHLLSHFGCQERTCKHCGKDFKKTGSYEAHMALHEKEMAGDKKNNICETCGAAFYFPYQLRQHAKRHKERQFICTFPGCRWKFVYDTELKYHIRSHTNYKPYLCDICGYAGTTKTRLLRHSRTHTGERKFHCEYCEYKAGNYTHLHRHMRIHIGSKPYKCPYCDYSCNTHENIRKHIAKTKKHAGLKIYPCKFCDFATNVGNDFRNHLLDAHEDMVGGRHIEALSEFTGLYKRELDPKEPLEGTRIIPLKERKPRVSKLLNEQKQKSVRDPSLKDDANTSHISKAVLYFNQDHGNMSLRENVSNNQSHEVVNFCGGNDLRQVQDDSPFMPSAASQPLQLVNMTPVMLKPIDTSAKEHVTIASLQSSPAEHISFRTNTGTKFCQAQIQSGIRSLLSGQGGSFRQPLLSFAGEENESKDQMDEDGHNLVIDMAYGNQN